MERIRRAELSGQKRGRGKPPLGKKPGRTVLRRLYIGEERSIREIADIQGCTKDMVARALKEYGIVARTNIKRSRLREYSLAELEAGVEKAGIRGFSRELGVDEGTLRHQLKVRKAN